MEYDGRTKLVFFIGSKLVCPGASIAVIYYFVLTAELEQHTPDFCLILEMIKNCFSARLSLLLQAVAGHDTSIQVISVVEAQVVVLLKGEEPGGQAPIVRTFPEVWHLTALQVITSLNLPSEKCSTSHAQPMHSNAQLQQNLAIGWQQACTGRCKPSPYCRSSGL